MGKYVKYAAFASPAILALIAFLSYVKDRKILALQQEKHSLEKELLSLQIKSIKQNQLF